MGTYLGLFNGTICMPQIVAALLGGVILGIFTMPGEAAPQVLMLVVAGVLLFIGACCVYFIKETSAEKGEMVNDVADSETL